MTPTTESSAEVSIDHLDLFGLVIECPIMKGCCHRTTIIHCVVAAADMREAVTSGVMLTAACESAEITPDQVRTVLAFGRCCDRSCDLANRFCDDMERQGIREIRDRRRTPVS